MLHSLSFPFLSKELQTLQTSVLPSLPQGFKIQQELNCTDTFDIIQILLSVLHQQD